MDLKLLVVFTVLSVVNVLVQTLKSLATIKCGKWVASASNALAYFIYTFVLVYTMADLPLLLKATITAIANLIGVYLAKTIEEKLRKDKVWKIDLTIRKQFDTLLQKDLENADIPFQYQTLGKHTAYVIYAETQSQTAIVKSLAKTYNGKTFASETKVL